MSVQDTLTAASVSADAISKLDGQGMLDAELLIDSTAAELQTGCGLTMGDAKRIKRAYPSPAAAQPTAPAAPANPLAPGANGPVTVVFKAPEAKTDEQILQGVKSRDEASLEDARARWQQPVYVTAADGSLDVPATLKALKFFKQHGLRDRFENSSSAFVQVLTLDQLLNEEEELNPLTLNVLVPGEPMSKLTAEQRLLIAFGIVNGAIRETADEDGVIDSVQRMTSRWELVSGDLKQAQGQETDVYLAAKRRLKRKAGSAPAPTVGSGSVLAPKPAALEPLGVFRVDRVSGMEYGALSEALVEAFPNVRELAQMTRVQLNQNLNNISGNDNVGHAAFELIQWAMSRGRLNELVQGAWRQNPGSPKLRAFCARYIVS